MKSDSIQHSFYLPKDFDAQVRTYIAESGISFSALARQGMKLYMQQVPLPPKQLELSLDAPQAM